MNKQLDSKHLQSLAARLMPEQPAQIALLHERALELAQTIESEDHAEDESEYLKFTLNDDKLYGVPKNSLNEVIYAKHVTSIPGVPPFIAGVACWQDKIISVLDTNYICTAQPHHEINDPDRIIVVGNDEKTMGLLVGSVDNYCRFKTSELASLSTVSGPVSLDCFFGVLSNSAILLNIDKLLADAALVVNQ